MQFRRSGQRDDRRRRVLMDENAEDANKKSRAKTAGKTDANQCAGYTDSARTDRQPRITDFLPRRPWVLALLLFAAALCLAGLGLLHIQASEWSRAIPQGDLSALNLSAPANLGIWFASTVLMLGAVASLQVYALRRHKMDDYRGRYRIWLWTALVFVLASIDATANLHLALPGLVARLAGESLRGSATLWWVGLYSVVVGGFALRMLVEVRRSKAAIAFLTLAIVAYGTSAALKLDLVTVQEQSSAVIAQATVPIVGHLLAVFSIWFFARRVHLEVHDQVPVAAPKAKAKAKSQQTPKRTTRRKTTKSAEPKSDDAAKEQPAAKPVAEQPKEKPDQDKVEQLEEEIQQKQQRTRKTRKSRPAKAAATESPSVEEDHEELEDSIRMTKSERKKAKKQRRTRRAA